MVCSTLKLLCHFMGTKFPRPAAPKATPSSVPRYSVRSPWTSLCVPPAPLVKQQFVGEKRGKIRKTSGNAWFPERFQVEENLDSSTHRPNSRIPSHQVNLGFFAHFCKKITYSRLQPTGLSWKLEARSWTYFSSQNEPDRGKKMGSRIKKWSWSQIEKDTN